MCQEALSSAWPALQLISRDLPQEEAGRKSAKNGIQEKEV